MTSTGSNKKIRVLLTEEAAQAYVEEMLLHPNRETACGTVGLYYPNGTMVINGVIRPAIADIVRNHSTVEFGGKVLKDTVTWLMENFTLVYKDRGKGFPSFAFFTKMHSHHGLGVDNYSSTDKQTLLEAIQKHKLPRVIGVLGLIDENAYEYSTPVVGRPGTVIIKKRATVALRFYYLDHEMVAQGITEPILVTPKIIKGSKVPALPPLAWKFTDEELYRSQMKGLEGYGARVVVLHKNVDEDPIQEVQFVITKSDWKGFVIITTDWDFPRSAPRIQVAMDSDSTLPGKEIHEVNENPEGKPLWTQGSDLLSVIKQLEDMKELKDE